MKTIRDIRLYKSEAKHENGRYMIREIGDKKLSVIAHRIAMKLRENDFSLGEFDHLYVNFTICDTEKEMALSEDVDIYHPWYRYCTVKIEKDIYAKLGSEEIHVALIRRMRAALVALFSTEHFDEQKIVSCINQALEQGENMLMKFKEKKSAKCRAVIYLRYLDSGMFYPLLRVFDAEGKLLMEKDLPESLMLDYIGDIRISTNRITIKPKNNAIASALPALFFEY